MELRRKNQRDDRRRRVLRDEGSARTEPSNGPARSDVAIAGRTYTDAALADLQPRLTDFLPLRPFAVALTGLVCLFFVAVPMGLDTLAHTFARNLPSHRLLIVDQHPSCANWSASICLLFAAFVALLVFNIRRHKLDDYRGRYGLWAWATLLLLIASVDVATGIHDLAAEVITKLTGSPLRGDGSLWWFVLATSAATIIGIRMLIDMRHSFASCGLLLTSIGCYGIAAAVHWSWWTPVPLPVAGMVRASLLLVGHTSLLFALILYARHVFLDAQGALHVAKGRKKSRSKAKRFERLLFWKKLSAAWQARRAARQRQAIEAAEASRTASHESDDSHHPADRDDDDMPADDDVESDGAQMDEDELERLTDPNQSRSDRRRQKKDQRRQQRNAA